MHRSDEDTHDHTRRGVFYAIVAATLFGISAPFSKLLLHGGSPQLFAGLLYLGSGTGLTLLWLGRRATSGSSTNALTRRDVAATRDRFLRIEQPVEMQVTTVRQPIAQVGHDARFEV